MSEWPKVEFQSLAADAKSAFSKPYGSAITKEDYVPQGVPVVRGVNLRNGLFLDDEFVFISEQKADQMPGANLAPGDMVFTHRGTIGQVSMIPRDPRYPRYVLSTSQVKARLNPKCALPEFYYYWFTSSNGRHELLRNVSTVGVPGLGQPVATIKSLRVPHPPLRVQRAIADVLGALDHKIAVNDRTVRSCHQLAQAISADAHTDSPVKALAEVANITMGSSPPGESYNENGVGVPFYQGARDFGVRFPSRRIWCASPRRIAKRGSTLVSVRAPVGELNIAREPSCIGRGVAAVESRYDTPSVLFHELAGLPDVWKPYESEGTVFGSIAKAQMENLMVKSLEQPAAQRLEAAIGPLDQRVEAAFIENQALSRLRDVLLPRLMSGEIRVREAEKIVEGMT
jgi:type I restriction enzyme, S subunit